MDLANCSKVIYSLPAINGSNAYGGSLPSPYTNVEIISNTNSPSKGTLEISHRLNEATQIRISFEAILKNNISTVRTTFIEGSIHTYEGVSYIVVNYGESSDITQSGTLTLSTFSAEVSLIDYVFSKSQSSVILPYPTTSYISASEISTAADVPYSGFDFHIYLTRDNPNQTFSFSLYEEVYNRLKDYQKVIYTQGSSLAVRSPANTTPVRGIIAPVQVSGSPSTVYKSINVNWNKNLISPFTNNQNQQLANPPVVYIQEGDNDLTTAPISALYDDKGNLIGSYSSNNPTLPSENNKLATQSTWWNLARALHLVFDNNGITKQVRITKKVNGSIEWIETYKYGFMFTVRDFAGSVQNSWKLIEYSRTVYKYEEVNQQFETIKYKDSAGVWRETIVDPALQELLSQSTVKYLVGTETTGYKFIRFVQETFNPNSWDVVKDAGCPGTIFYGARLFGAVAGYRNSGDNNSYFRRMYNLYLFRQVPIYGKTTYHLVSADSLYKDAKKSLAVSIEKIPYSALPINLQNQTTPDADGFVGIAKPDPNSYKEYLVISETTENMALAWQSNPSSIKYNNSQSYTELEEPAAKLLTFPDKYNPNLNPYIVGENTISSVERRVIPNNNTTSVAEQAFIANNSTKYSGFSENANASSTANLKNNTDIYVEYSKNKNYNGNEFVNQAELTQFSEVEGRPATATVARDFVLEPSTEENPWDANQIYKYNGTINSSYYTTDTDAVISLLEIPETDLASSKLACDFQLQMDNAINTKEMSVDIGFYRPEYLVGDITTIPYSEGKWLIKSVTHSFTFNGKFLTANPTKLTLGRWYTIQSTLTPTNFSSTVPTDASGSSVTYDVLGSQYPLEFSPQLGTPNRVGERGSEQPIII